MAAMRASDAIRDRIQHLQSSFGVSSTFLRIEQARLGEYLTNAHFEEFIRDGRLDPIPWTPKRLRERKPRESDHMQLAKLLHGIACAGCRAHKLVTVSECMALMRAEFWLAEQDQAVEWLTDGRLWRQLGAPIFLRLAEQYDWPAPQDERFAAMARGEMCSEDCLDCERPPDASAARPR